jgi:hypothetical protein
MRSSEKRYRRSVRNTMHCLARLLLTPRRVALVLLTPPNASQ